MSKSIKAALLSALVFPGVGHFFLKQRVSGTVLAAAALVSLWVVITKAMERALQITEEIQRGDVPLDVDAITELVSRQPAGVEGHLLDIAWAVLIVVWLIGIVDSYRVGRIQGKADLENPQTRT